MIQYVEKLFQESKTIILPGLGALTITNPDTKEMMFMPYLKHDDGVLSGFIEKEAGVSSEESKKMVSDEVHQILNEIEAGKSVPFGTFGSFTKDADGDLTFENTSNNDEPQITPEKKEAKEETPKKDEKKEAEEVAAQKAAKEAETKKQAEEAAKKKAQEEAVAKKAAQEAKANKASEEAEAKKEVAEEKQKEAEKVSPAAAPISSKEEMKVTPKAAEKPKESPKPTERPKETTAKSTVNQVIPDLATNKEATSGKNILEKEEIAANQQKLDQLKKVKEQPQKKKRKRGAGFYILLSLLIIIVAGGTFVALNYEEAKEYLPFLADSEAAEPTKESDGILEKVKEKASEPESTETEQPETEPIENTTESEEEASNEETVEETPVQETPKQTPSPTPAVSGSNNQPFHIVAGVFSEASNAERLADKIKGMGYPAKTFSRGAQTVVSVQSYATAAEAQAALSSVQDAAPKGWVLEWRN